MIERDNSCLGKIRKDMDKIKIRSRALNTQTKYRILPQISTHCQNIYVGKGLRSQFSILAQSGLAQFANILWSQLGDTLPGRIIGLLSFSLQRHIWPRGQFYNTNQNISRKRIWFLSFPSLIIVWPCCSVTLCDTEGSSFLRSDPCICRLGIGRCFCQLCKFFRKTMQFLTYFASLNTPKCKLSS